MADAQAKELIRLLQDIEERSQREGIEDIRQQGDSDLWDAVVFSVADKRLVAPLSEVREILNYPSAVTVVPGAKNWICGVANVRGNLLPIIDLQAFCGGRQTVTGRRSRVLVIDHQGYSTGLLVGEMAGMRHFSDETQKAEQAVEGPIGQYIDFVFEQGAERWPVFSMTKLTADPEFQVAAR